MAPTPAAAAPAPPPAAPPPAAPASACAAAALAVAAAPVDARGGPLFAAGQAVWYYDSKRRACREATIAEVHFDDDPPYFSVALPGGGDPRHTVAARLALRVPGPVVDAADQRVACADLQGDDNPGGGNCFRYSAAAGVDLYLRAGFVDRGYDPGLVVDATALTRHFSGWASAISARAMVSMLDHCRFTAAMLKRTSTCPSRSATRRSRSTSGTTRSCSYDEYASRVGSGELGKTNEYTSLVEILVLYTCMERAGRPTHVVILGEARGERAVLRPLFVMDAGPAAAVYEPAVFCLRGQHYTRKLFVTAAAGAGVCRRLGLSRGAGRWR